MTWLNFLNDCAEINKMLNASIQSLSTIHYPLSTSLRICMALATLCPAGPAVRTLRAAQPCPSATGPGHWASIFGISAAPRPRSTWWNHGIGLRRCWTMMATAGWMCC